MVSYQSAKDEIKRAADVVALIGQYVKLRKTGRNYSGLCPFHAEKDPSFSVNPERQSFHCFGCKKGGDIFSFWMEYHSTTFPEAVRDLAERYNITITEGYSAEAEKKKAAQRNTLNSIPMRNGFVCVAGRLTCMCMAARDRINGSWMPSCRIVQCTY